MYNVYTREQWHGRTIYLQASSRCQRLRSRWPQPGPRTCCGARGSGSSPEARAPPSTPPLHRLANTAFTYDIPTAWGQKRCKNYTFLNKKQYVHHVKIFFFLSYFHKSHRLNATYLDLLIYNSVD